MHFIDYTYNWLWIRVHDSAKKWMVRMLSDVLFHPHALQSLSADGCPTKRKCAAAFCYSAGRSYHFIFNSRTDSFCRRRVGRTFDWNCCPSSDSGGWRPCDLHSWHPDSPSTPQGHWLWPPEMPRRPSASPCNNKQKNIELDGTGPIMRTEHIQVSQSHRVSSAFCLFLSEDRIKRGGAWTASHRGHKTNASVH